MDTIKKKPKQIQVLLHDDRDAHKRAMELIKELKDQYGLSECSAIIYVLNEYAMGKVK